MTNRDFLVVGALGTGERPDLSGTVGGYYGRLVPVEDVAAVLALLPEGDDGAPLVHDLTARHLYRHHAPPPEETSHLELPLDSSRKLLPDG